MLNKKARKLIGYDSLVIQLASMIQPAELEELDTGDLKRMLGAGYERWEFKDWYRLLNDIKRLKRQSEHESMTPEVIFNGLPWAAQQAAQTAVKILIRKANEEKLFKMDETADTLENILWDMFYCMGIDIKNTAIHMGQQNKRYSCKDWEDNLLLLDFIRELRKIQWYENGEVARLRDKEKG